MMSKQRYYIAIAILLVLSLPSCLIHAYDYESFDIHQHLSTATRYGAVKDIVDDAFVPANIPDTCAPIHLNLLARHGTRDPTDRRLKDMKKLEESLRKIIANATDHQLSLDNFPSWLIGWTSPWKGIFNGGELIVKGEHELYDLGIRIREKYSNLFNDEYHPTVHKIMATQKSRASASAVAFAMGLYSGNGSLGPGKHRAFAVNSTNDTTLSFFEYCGNYKNYKKSELLAVEKLKEPTLNEITQALIERHGLNFTSQDISFLWFLCKQEASLLDITNQACSLFNPNEIFLLEWTDDMDIFIMKGYGNSLNYRMGMHLLKDVMNSMELAVKANEEELPSGSYEKVKLRFAHAETLIPFSCLLGLFLQVSDFTEFNPIQKEISLELPPKPPQRRAWRGSVVAPFAGNSMLVLYSCLDRNSSKYFVQVLHNEHPVPLPGCNNTDFCPYDVFKERIFEPHMKHDFHSLCEVKVVPEPGPIKSSEVSSTEEVSLKPSSTSNEKASNSHHTEL